MAELFVFGAFAAFGALCALWGILGFVLSTGKAEAVICRAGSGSDFGFLRRLLLLRDFGFLRCRIMVPKQDLSPEEQMRLAEIGIIVCSREEILADLGIGAEGFDGTGSGDIAGNHRSGGVSEL